MRGIIIIVVLVALSVCLVFTRWQMKVEVNDRSARPSALERLSQLDQTGAPEPARLQSAVIRTESAATEALPANFIAREWRAVSKGMNARELDARIDEVSAVLGRQLDAVTDAQASDKDRQVLSESLVANSTLRLDRMRRLIRTYERDLK